MPSQINMSNGSVSIVLPKYLISGCSILPYPIYVVLILSILYHEQNTRGVGERRTVYSQFASNATLYKTEDTFPWESFHEAFTGSKDTL